MSPIPSPGFIPEAILDRASDAASKAIGVVLIDSRLTAHEAVCAVRYGYIVERLTRLERALYWATGILIMGMGSLIVTLLRLPIH